jgi:hypothetical protein
VTRARLAGALHPTATQAGLLRVVSAPPDELEARWRALQPLDLDHVEQGVLVFLPLVYLRLSHAGMEDPLLPRLKGAYRNVWYRNHLQLQRLPQLVDAGTDPILIGDVAVATAYYPHSGMRLIRQIEQLTVAGPRYIARPLRRAQLFEGFAARSTRRPIGGRWVRTLAPGDELLVACAAGAAPPTPTPDWLLDVRQILSTGAIGEPDRVASGARELGLAPQLRDGVAYLASIDPTVDAGELIAELGSRSTTRRDRIAYRMSGAPVGPFGFFPRTLAAHLRQSRSQSPLRVALSLPGYLGEEWGVGAGRVVLVAARKAARTLTRRRRREPV